MDIKITADMATLIRDMATAQGWTHQECAEKLLSIGYARKNALQRHYTGTVDPKWPAPGRKAKAKAKAKPQAKAKPVEAKADA